VLAAGLRLLPLCCGGARAVNFLRVCGRAREINDARVRSGRLRVPEAVWTPLRAVSTELRRFLKAGGPRPGTVGPAVPDVTRSVTVSNVPGAKQKGQRPVAREPEHDDADARRIPSPVAGPAATAAAAHELSDAPTARK
jgi:hypothetical protein